MKELTLAMIFNRSGFGVAGNAGEQVWGSWPATKRMEYPAPRRILLEGHPHLRVIAIARVQSSVFIRYLGNSTQRPFMRLTERISQGVLERCVRRLRDEAEGMKRQVVTESKRAVTILLCVAMGLVSAMAGGPRPAFAQDPAYPKDQVPAQNYQRMQSSDLARENLSRVAASAGEIKPLLLKDSGLMVELKRWVAKDATDHGQIITDADLTNDAIFDRLENDVEFRAVATLLLQKYGYLVPEVNPNSEAGKEQQLLLQERVKWITQEEEEARQQQHQQVAQAIQKERSCATGVQADCAQPQMRNLPAQNLQREQQLQQGQPQSPFQSNPGTPQTSRMFLFQGRGRILWNERS